MAPERKKKCKLDLNPRINRRKKIKTREERKEKNMNHQQNEVGLSKNKINKLKKREMNQTQQQR